MANFTTNGVDNGAVYLVPSPTSSGTQPERRGFSWIINEATVKEGRGILVVQVNLYVDDVLKATVPAVKSGKFPTPTTIGNLAGGGIVSTLTDFVGQQVPAISAPPNPNPKLSKPFVTHPAIPTKRGRDDGLLLLTSVPDTVEAAAEVPVQFSAATKFDSGSVEFFDMAQLLPYQGKKMYFELKWRDTMSPEKGFMYSYSRAFTVFSADPQLQEQARRVAGSAPYNVEAPVKLERADGDVDNSGGGGGGSSLVPVIDRSSTEQPSTMTDGFNSPIQVTWITTAPQGDATASVGADPGLPGSAAEPGTSSRSSSQLSTGAIAGIAVAAALVGLGLLAALIFCLIRRRRRNNLDQSAISPGGYGHHTPELIAQKEANAGVGVEVSPHSPYSDDGAGGHAVGAGGMLQHSSFRQEEMPLAGCRERDAHGSVGSREVAGLGDGESLRGSQTGVGRETPTAVRHLVEDGMTEDEIRRLEEEERELDQAIEQAGGGRR
ncbi:hypothetical protein GE09DRAFT_1064332 [Coniochaeta sp. 2T2.1]|nr:hypothetical protein GE09DRAFT_1064332 [Coniochaeta sp. 2T2.1]